MSNCVMHTQASYPSPARSIALGKKNLHLFRLKNTRCVASKIRQCKQVNRK